MDLIIINFQPSQAATTYPKAEHSSNPARKQQGFTKQQGETYSSSDNNKIFREQP